VDAKVILYALMFGLVGGLLWANKQYKMKGAIWARPLSILLGVGALVLAGIASYLQVNPESNSGEFKKFREHELFYQEAAFKQLGKLIAENHPDAKALLIMPKPLDSMGGAAGVDSIAVARKKGLMAGLGDSVEIVAREEVLSESAMMYAPYGEEQDMMLDDIFSAKVMDGLLKANKDCNVVISLAGMPTDVGAMSLWKIKDKAKRPVVYLANASVASVNGLQWPIENGFIGGCLMDKPVAFDITKEPPADEMAAFEQRFLIVTPANAKALDSEYGLFPKEKK
jgi:hypothetical protein